jgi:acyl carrier protein
MTATEVDTWNSFTHMVLINAIETEFQTRLTFEEVRALNCVGDIVELLHNKLKR